MKHIAILLGVCLLFLCIAPVHALFAGDDGIWGAWCPAGGGIMEGDILWNDIPNTPPVTPVLVEDAKYGHVYLFQDGRVSYFPDFNRWDSAKVIDTFRYRTFDGIDYSNEATVEIYLYPSVELSNGKSLKFSTAKDTMLSAQILDDLEWMYEPYMMEAEYGDPYHGTLLDWEINDLHYWHTPYFHYMPDPGFEGVDIIGYDIGIDTGECGLMIGMPGTIEITVGNPNPIPEFPSTVLPTIFVIGFLGAVLLIRRTREN